MKRCCYPPEHLFLPDNKYGYMTKARRVLLLSRKFTQKLFSTSASRRSSLHLSFSTFKYIHFKLSVGIKELYRLILLHDNNTT